MEQSATNVDVGDSDELASFDRFLVEQRMTPTYKFKRAFFRHNRRTAPKFGTHVRIETRLALTKKN